MNDLMVRQTAGDIVKAYQSAYIKMRDGYLLLADAEKEMVYALGRDRNYVDTTLVDRYWSGWNHLNPNETIDKIDRKIKQAVWQRILETLEVQKIASISRYQEIQEQIKEDKLPDVTLESIFELLDAFLQNASEIQDELLEEIFKMLTPRRSDYKTNSFFSVGKRVILTGKFHLLDGKGIPGGYKSPLVDAINTSGKNGTGSTDYFFFRCYQNNNLHITFLRADLVKILNRRCHELWLNDGKK